MRPDFACHSRFTHFLKKLPSPLKQATDYVLTDFDVSSCFTSEEIYDFYFTMTGPFDKLSPQKAQEFADGIIGAICVTTGLSLQNRLQHAHVDLFTDYEVCLFGEKLIFIIFN